MGFEKIGKGEALLWLSGASGLSAASMLAALLFNWSYSIPEIGFSPARLFYPTFFVIALVVSYILYRVGVAGEKPAKAASVWFSGVFGKLAVGELVLAVMGWGFVVPQLGLSFSSASQPLAFAAAFVVEVILCLALWNRAKGGACRGWGKALAAKIVSKGKKRK
ncbi:MAG: hypothetical protein AABW54_02755 [Candidatus Micrarchaeota archaeon]